MHKFLKTIFVILILSISLSAAQALVKVKVKGEIETNKKKPKIEEQKEAIEQGKKLAINKWASGLDSQRLQMLNDMMSSIYADLDKYILEVNTLNEGEWANGKWSINLEVSINDAQIDQLLNREMQKSISQQGELFLSFVFVAREVSSVAKFDATIDRQAASTYNSSDGRTSSGTSQTQTNTHGNVSTLTQERDASASRTNVDANSRTNTNTHETQAAISARANTSGSSGSTNVSVSGKYSESAGSATTNTNAQAQVNTTQQSAHVGTKTVDTVGSQTQTTTSGGYSNQDRNVSQSSSFKSSGSVIQNSEGIAFRVYNPMEIDSKVSEVFNKANFAVVPSYEANITPEQFAYDFASINEISTSTQKEATDLAREAGLDFLAIGMLDVGREELDSVTGQSKVYAKVTGYVLDLRKRFAVKICSVGPVQYSGLGENPTVAKTNALIEASMKASQDLVDQLRVKIGM